MKYSRVISFVLAFLTIAFSGSATHAQEATHLPKPATGPKVELSLIVTDKSKKSVNSIRKNDVRVVENRVEQVIESVVPDERPTDYGLIIDGSGSLRGLQGAILEASRMIITNRRTSDQIFVELFASSEKIRTIQDFSSDNSIMLESLKNLEIMPGPSAVIDALYVAAEKLAKHHQNTSGRRKALVIITDGEDRQSEHSLNKLTKLFREQDIQVFVIGLVSELEANASFVRGSPRQKAEQLLNMLAEDSGGRVFYPYKASELTDAAAQISHDLRAQFRVIYQSQGSTQTGFRKVEVKLVPPSGETHTAIAPRGYYVESKDVKP